MHIVWFECQLASIGTSRAFSYNTAAIASVIKDIVTYSAFSYNTTAIASVIKDTVTRTS